MEIKYKDTGSSLKHHPFMQLLPIIYLSKCITFAAFFSLLDPLLFPKGHLHDNAGNNNL